jgi:hypothetical protein
MHVELGMPERLVAVQLGHTDGGKLVPRALWARRSRRARGIDRYVESPSNVVRLPEAVRRIFGRRVSRNRAMYTAAVSD